MFEKRKQLNCLPLQLVILCAFSLVDVYHFMGKFSSQQIINNNIFPRKYAMTFHPKDTICMKCASLY